jgi:hypothetical protein
MGCLMRNRARRSGALAGGGEWMGSSFSDPVSDDGHFDAKNVAQFARFRWFYGVFYGEFCGIFL